MREGGGIGAALVAEQAGPGRGEPARIWQPLWTGYGLKRKDRNRKGKLGKSKGWERGISGISETKQIQ